MLLVLLPAGRGAAAPAPVERCELLLRPAPGLDAETARTLLEQSGLAPRKVYTALGVWLVDCGPAPGEAAALQLARTAAGRLESGGAVAWAEPNFRMVATERGLPGGGLWGPVRVEPAVVTPNDVYYLPQQGNLRQVGLPYAWLRTTGDAAPVAVIDTALDLAHPDLQTKFWRNPDEIPSNGLDDDGNGYVDDLAGWDFYDGDADPAIDPSGDSSHGTHVSGILAAETNNGLGVAGVSWESPLMPLRALGRNASGPYSAVIEAILYAADNGARVVNLSLGGSDPSLALEEAVAYAAGKGCLLVASAGNDGGPVLYPAALPDVIAVGAVDASDLPAAFSNRGPEVELAAPGVAVFSTVNGSYAIQSGTSQSTPHVSGAAALVWSLQPGWSAVEVRQALVATALDVWSPGRDDLTGYGRLDAAAAVESAVPLRFYYFPFAPLGGLLP